jgi:hypothetical protein
MGRKAAHHVVWLELRFRGGTAGEGSSISGLAWSLRDRAARFADLDPALLIQALLIRYDPGAGIGCIAIAPSTHTLWKFRWDNLLPCVSGAGAPVDLREYRYRWNREELTTSAVPPVMIGNTVLPKWSSPVGPSRSEASPKHTE